MSNDILGVYGVSDMEKAIKDKKKEELLRADPKSAFIDPTNVLDYVGTRAKPSQIGYAVLRAMAIRAEPVSAIINTRSNEVIRFAKRPEYEGDTGFAIRIKDKEREPTKAEQNRAKEIEEGILHTGFIRNAKRKDNFDQFLRKILRDSLILDALAFEVVPDRKGRVAEWYAVDGATVEMVSEMAIPSSDHKSPIVYQPVTRRGRAVEGDVAYVQRISGQVYAEYTEEELAYAIRNPRTDIMFALYGLSELEVLIETITGILNAKTYNAGYFSHSHLPQGILEIVGKYEPAHLEAFKRAWESLLSGAVGKWKVPVIALEDGQGLKFTPFKQNNRDMEFHQWLEFLTTTACAVYQIDPSEIGMKPWSGGKGGGMIQSDAEATRLQHSKDKGFYPLMKFLANTFQTELIERIDPEFEFVWVGLNEEDQAMKEKQRAERIASGYRTVNEERKQNDQTTIEQMMIDAGYTPEQAKKLGMWGDAPANPQLLQVFTTHLQAEMQKEQIAMQGEQQMAMQGGQQEHELKRLEKEHIQKLEAQGYTHEQAKEMAKVQMEQERAKMQMQHGQTLEQQNFQHTNAKEMANTQFDQEKQKMQIQHGQALEQQSFQHSNTKEIAEQEPKKDPKKDLKKSLYGDDSGDIVIEIEID